MGGADGTDSGLVEQLWRGGSDGRGELSVDVGEFGLQLPDTAGEASHHQPIDVFSHFSDKDFRLGLNAAQTTLGAIGQLVGATIKK